MKVVKDLVDQAATETRDFILNDIDLRLVRVRREFSSSSPSKPAARTPLSPVRGGMAGAGAENQLDLAQQSASLLEGMKKELKVWVGRRLGGVMQENTAWMNERVEVLRDELNSAFVKGRLVVVRSLPPHRTATLHLPTCVPTRDPCSAGGQRSRSCTSRLRTVPSWQSRTWSSCPRSWAAALMRSSSSSPPSSLSPRRPSTAPPPPPSSRWASGCGSRGC